MMDYLLAIAMLCGNHSIDKEKCQVNVITCVQVHKDKMQPFPTPMVVERCYLDSRNMEAVPLTIPKK